jgi:hypothetical protein
LRNSRRGEIHQGSESAVAASANGSHRRRESRDRSRFHSGGGRRPGHRRRTGFRRRLQIRKSDTSSPKRPGCMSPLSRKHGGRRSRMTAPSLPALSPSLPNPWRDRIPENLPANLLANIEFFTAKILNARQRQFSRLARERSSRASWKTLCPGEYRRRPGGPGCLGSAQVRSSLCCLSKTGRPPHNHSARPGPCRRGVSSIFSKEVNRICGH